MWVVSRIFLEKLHVASCYSSLLFVYVEQCSVDWIFFCLCLNF